MMNDMHASVPLKRVLIVFHITDAHAPQTGIGLPGAMALPFESQRGHEIRTSAMSLLQERQFIFACPFPRNPYQSSEAILRRKHFQSAHILRILPHSQ